MRGIDISHHNGWPFKKDTAKAYLDSDFVIIKATQGTSYKYTDYFEKAIKKAIQDDKLVGAYHYASGKDAVMEADYFVSIVTPYLGKIILALDWESYQNSAWGKDTRWAKRFVDRVRLKTGLTCFLYTNMDGIKQCKNLANNVPLWFAGYPANSNSWSIPKWPAHYSTKPWTHYDIWQYTSGGDIVDRNISNLTIDDWNSFTGCTFLGTPDLTVTADDVIKVMSSWIGKSRAKGTHKDLIDLYNSYTPLPRNYKVSYTDSYCAVTVSDAFITLDAVDLIGGVECSVQRFIDIFKKKGIWNEDGRITPKPGYIITYNWDDSTQPNDGWADHIGVVSTVENGYITAIEGNISGNVGTRKIKVGDGRIRGYAIPAYGIRKQVTPTGSILDLVVDVLKGKYSNGDARKSMLGTRYQEVQDFINHIEKSPIDMLAQEALAGKYGNGDTRKLVLGNKYADVQKKVNELVRG